MAQDTQGQIQEFLDVLRKRRWLIVLPTLFVTAIGIALAVVVPKKYEILTEIEIRESRIETDYRLRDPNENATKIELQNARDHIQNWRRIQEIIEASPELWPEYFALEDPERREFIQRVRNNLDVQVAEKKRDRGSTFVTITYTDVEAKRGESFLETLTSRWIHEVIDRDRQTLMKERDILQEEESRARRQSNDARESYFKLATEMGIDPITFLTGGRSFGPSVGDPRYGEAIDLEAQIQEITADVSREEAEVDAQREALQMIPQLIPTDVRVAGSDQTARIEALRMQIEELRSQQEGKTPDNSMWKLLERKIEGLRKQIEELTDMQVEPTLEQELAPNPERAKVLVQIQDKEREILGLKAQRTTLQDQLARMKLENTRLTSDWEDLSFLREEYERFTAALDTASQQLREKELAIDILNEAHGEPFDINRPPKATPEPVEPNPLLIVTVAVIAGLALGLFLAVAVEFLPNSYRTSSEVARVLGVPVLGAIGMIVTRAERRRAAARHTLVGVSSAVILACMGWFIWTLAYSQDTLPTDVRKAIEDLQLMLM